LCEGQGEVRRNAVTVDRGPVLVQVLQSPMELTKRNNDENDEYLAAAPDPTGSPPKIAAIHYQTRVCTLVLTGPINFRRFIMPTSVQLGLSTTTEITCSLNSHLTSLARQNRGPDCFEKPI